MARNRFGSNNPNYRHGHAMDGFSSEYNSWRGMIDRCSNPNHASYFRYGGRGICVCPRWMEFENFIYDMGARPRGSTLDRIDNNGNYEPGNCRWATAVQQARTHSGELHEHAKLNQMSVRVVRKCAALRMTQRQIADVFAVSQSVISDVVRGVSWKEAPMGHKQEPTDIPRRPNEIRRWTDDQSRKRARPKKPAQEPEPVQWTRSTKGSRHEDR